MTLRTRITVLTAAAVAASIVGTSIVTYATDRSELISQVDASLRASRTFLLRPPPLNAPAGGARLPHRAIPTGTRKLTAGGSVTTVTVRLLPPHYRGASKRIDTVTVRGVTSRATTFVRRNRLITISQPLTSVNRVLAHLRWLLLWISLAGIGGATLLGLLVSRIAINPLRRLTEATERILETRDLTTRLRQPGRDEVARLATRLDELLDDLDTSLRTQRQFIADASHELRTPMATLRANVEVLAADASASEEERSELTADIQGELEAMTALVSEMIELTRGEETDTQHTPCRLDVVVQTAVKRAQRRSRSARFTTSLAPSVVVGSPERIERAVSNLLDNAQKWTPDNEPIDVEVHDGRVIVRDHGPGISDADLPLIFNRFYRSADARGRPGAGLGLAIVKQIAEAHGGAILISRAETGGTIAELRLTEVDAPGRPEDVGKPHVGVTVATSPASGVGGSR